MSAIDGSQSQSGPSLAAAIAAHGFVADMRPGHLNKLLEVAMFKQFERDEMIFREGDPANRFYLVCQGKIALESGRKSDGSPLLHWIGPGEVLGWSWLFPPYCWHFSARAAEPTLAVFFYGTRLRQACDEDPVFGYELMKRVAAIVIQRLQVTRRHLLQLQDESSRKASPAPNGGP
ncbi:MAG TPA: Crp/Fnr family transcriptional regulator [Candidatus Acidoferrum sp.]|nr:Crp/Fnr family transcriptional regulator [Candidatus Acidoferrum sp.]